MSSCVKCANRAELLCSRCFDPYCSISCHLQDWPEHRFSCKPIPGLIKIEALLELKNGGSPKSKNAVAANETLSIAKEVTPVMKEATSPMPALVIKSNHMSPSNNMATEKPVKASPQMRFSTANPTKNNTVAAAVEELSQIISSKPGLAVSEQNVSKVSNHEKEDTSKPSRKGPPKFLKLRPLKSETLQKPVKRYFMTELKVVPLREGKDVTLFVTDTSLLKEFVIGALDSDNKARLEMTENVKKLAKYCAVAEKNNTGYHPEVAELCLAIFDEDKEWYRAFVMDKKEGTDIYNVQFVDYGNVAEVSSAKIMPMTEELMFPTCTNLCLIVNASEQDLPKLQEYLDANSSIKGDVKYSDKNDIYEIDISKHDAILK